MAGQGTAAAKSAPLHILQKQEYYQKVHRLTHLKGPYDRITSVIIPAALAAVGLSMVGRGIWNMAHGTGKIE